MKTYMNFLNETINLDKAKAKGYDTKTIWYHGTPFDFNKFDVSKSSGENAFGTGVYLTSKKEDAEGYKQVRRANPVDVLGSFDTEEEANTFARENDGVVTLDNNEKSPFVVSKKSEGNVFELVIRGKYVTPETHFQHDKILQFMKASPNFEEKKQDFFAGDEDDFVTYVRNVTSEYGPDVLLEIQNIFYKNSDDYQAFVANAKKILGVDGIIINNGSVKHAVVFDPKNVRRIDAKFEDTESNDLMG